MNKHMKTIKDAIRRTVYWFEVLRCGSGSAVRECPLCGHRGTFKAYGHPPRYDALCPQCGSLERHRLLVLMLARLNVLAPPMTLLHFAPEPILKSILKRQVANYIDADVEPGKASRVLNMEAIDLPSGTVDVVMANHVLEHVDDKAALSEIFRILKPEGLLVATVPLVEGWLTTYENSAIISKADREIHFGQHDHIRYYGRDFRDRVTRAGFVLDEFVGDGADTARYALLLGERVFLAHKPKG